MDRRPIFYCDDGHRITEPDDLCATCAARLAILERERARNAAFRASLDPRNLPREMILKPKDGGKVQIFRIPPQPRPKPGRRRIRR